MEEESARRPSFWTPSERPPYLHLKMRGLLDGMSKATYEEQLRIPGTIDFTKCGTFAYEFTKGGAKKYRTYPYQLLRNAIYGGDINYVHEAYFPGRPVKPFFDIDYKLGEDDQMVTEQDVVKYIRDFCRHLAETCGFSADQADWRFMETLHERKFSLHAVCNDGQHFADANAQLRFMRERDVDFEKFYIDTKVYAEAGSSLRMLGSAHFDNQDVCQLRGVHNTEVTMPILFECLAQAIPPGSRLIEVAPVARRGPARRFNGDYAHCINPVLELMRELGNPDVRASAIGYDKELDRVCFDLDNCTRCRFQNHEASIQRCFVNPSNMVCLKKCQGCDCADELFGLTPDARRFMKQRNYLNFIRLHGLCRVDMFLFHETPGQRTYGCYDLTPEEFWAKQRRPASCRCVFCQDPNMALPPDFCEFDPARDGGSLMSVEFFNFLRSYARESAEGEMAGYISLFVTHNTETGTIYFRGTKGVISVAKEWITAELGKFKRYHYEWKGKQGEKYEARSEKAFYPAYFVGTAHFKPIQYTSTGAFSLTRDSPLNLCPPKAVDTNAAIRDWVGQTPANRDCIKAVWATLLEMVCEYEPRGNMHNIKCRQQFQRWFMECGFKVGIPTNIMMLLMSDEGGIGKSTIPTLLARILGALLYCEPGSCEMFFKTQFNSNTNGFVNFDEIVCYGDLVEKIKQAITAKFIRLEEKFKKPYMADNARNIYASTNAKTFAPINENGFERRIVVHKILPRKVLEEKGLFKYRCLHCERRRDLDGEELACKHDFVDHKSWSDILYDGIINGDELRLAFVGYLAELYRSLAPTWNVSLQAGMICTRATADVQTQKQSVTAKVIDDFNARGYHWTPFLNPKLNTGQWHRSDDVVRLGQDVMPFWEEKVVFANLYQAIRDECVASGVKTIPTKETVIDELGSISMSRLQKPLQWADERCVHLVYSKANIQAVPMWENENKHTMCRVLDMGLAPWFKPDNAALPARKQLARSETFGSLPGGDSSNSFPEQDIPEDTRAVAEGASQRRKTVMALARMLEDEDANDGEEALLRKARKIREDDSAPLMAERDEDDEQEDDEEAEEAPFGIDEAMEGEEED